MQLLDDCCVNPSLLFLDLYGACMSAGEALRQLQVTGQVSDSEAKAISEILNSGGIEHVPVELNRAIESMLLLQRSSISNTLQ